MDSYVEWRILSNYSMFLKRLLMPVYWSFYFTIVFVYVCTHVGVDID
jgi:hypothetical protein